MNNLFKNKQRVVKFGNDNKRALLFFGLVFSTNATVLYLTSRILFSGGITSLEIVILFCFSLTFGWVTISFWNAVIGFILILFKVEATKLHDLKTPLDNPSVLTSKTALIMPVRNEDPKRTMACLSATLQSLTQSKHCDSFDAYVLSDTDDNSLCSIEKNFVCELSRSLPKGINLYYRNRNHNTGHKAGNIRDFCQKWGKNYEFMVILDSDSIMEGGTLIELVSLMESNPNAGLIQTVPLPINQKTLFGRILQFSSALYGPVVAWGQTFWYSNNSNYWGHNAIIRTKAFTDSCGLPNFPGRPPFGGEILSHDFVEAALLKRAGWDLFMLPHLKGSYEMIPEDIFAYVRRERRWAQGSLQHLRLIRSKDLHIMNRIHFLMGAMGYLSSVLWISLLVSSTAYILSLETGKTFFFLEPYFLWSAFSGNSWSPLLSPLLITGFVLLVPKALSFILVAIQSKKRPVQFSLLALSTLSETIFAILLAPILMFYHTSFIFGFLSGGKIKWNPSDEKDTAVCWKTSFSNTAFITISCIAWSSLILWYSPIFLLWMLPVFVGPILAGPIIFLTTKTGFSGWTNSLNFLTTPRIIFFDNRNRDPRKTKPSTPKWIEAAIEPPPENPRVMPTQTFL